MRREWIEIATETASENDEKSPSMRREWIEMMFSVLTLLVLVSLPPCGGSGLKSLTVEFRFSSAQSPSMRREWIEIFHGYAIRNDLDVSLHAEGVD